VKYQENRRIDEIEIIVINDGSKDRTVEVAKEAGLIRSSISPKTKALRWPSRRIECRDR